MTNQANTPSTDVTLPDTALRVRVRVGEGRILVFTQVDALSGSDPLKPQYAKDFSLDMPAEVAIAQAVIAVMADLYSQRMRAEFVP